MLKLRQGKELGTSTLCFRNGVCAGPAIVSRLTEGCTDAWLLLVVLRRFLNSACLLVSLTLSDERSEVSFDYLLVFC